MSAKVSRLMLGMSAETFWGGVEGGLAFEKSVRESLPEGLGLTTGATASHEALKAFGAKTISVITPCPSIGDKNVRQYFTEMGYTVKAVKGLNRPSATAIAETPIKKVIDAIKEVDHDNVDAILQCGTNLSTVDLFPALEHWLEKPLIPISVATVWHALRACDINDKIQGKGRLLEEF